MKHRLLIILKFLKNWNELISVPIAIVLWFVVPDFVRLIDPTAAFYDAGVLQQILYAVIAVFIFHGLAWLIIKLTFPKVYDYLDNILEETLNSPYSSQWEHTKTVLFLFALYFLAFILTLKTLV